MKLSEMSPRRRIVAVAVAATAVAVVAVAASFLIGGTGKKRASVPKLELSDADQQAMAEYGYAVIDRYFDQSLPKPALPKVNLGPKDYDQMFATLLSHGKIRCSWGGGRKNKSKDRVAEDSETAITKCIEDQRFGGPLTKTEAKDVDLVFNILYGKRRVAKNNLKYQKKRIELGVHALELRAGKRSAFFKESVAISKNYNHKKLLQRLCRKAKQSKGCAQSKGVKLYKFETTTFKANRQGEIAELFRYNTLVKPSEVTEERVEESIRLGAAWFLNNLNAESGLPEYEYHPSLDKYSKKDNDVRRLGALWSMTEADQFQGKNDFRKVVDATLGHYFKGLRIKGGGGIAPENVAARDEVQVRPDGDLKIAYNAFAIYSLINTPEYPNRDNLIRAFGNGLVGQQKADGSLRTYFDSNKKGGEDFYPGEALFALAWLHKVTDDARYLDAVKKAFPFYRDYWRKKKTTAFVPWHSRADRLLYEATKDEEVAEFVFEMQDFIWKYQLEKHRYPDIVGGIKKGGIPQMSTCTYSEGLADAHAVAKQMGNAKREKQLGEHLMRAARFILQLQYTEENLFYLQNPKRALGGFRANPTNNRQRNDFTQHCLLALIKLTESGLVE